MSDQFIVNTVRSTTTHIFGRSLNSAGVHHFVIDGSTEPKEEIVPVDAFLSGVSSCAVHLLERFAQEEGVPLQLAEAEIVGARPTEEPHRFDHVDLKIELTGPTQAQAEALVERFKRR